MQDVGAGAGAAGEGAGAAGAGAGGAQAPSQFAEYGGIDPNLDPELAMALRISLEEEKARQGDDEPPKEGASGDAKPAEGGEGA